jgi:hypothetical protein
MVAKTTVATASSALAVVAAAALGLILGANVVATQVYLPLPWHGQPAIHNIASLPQSIGSCGRSWSKDATGRGVTFADASTQGGGVTPAVADPGLLTARPANACSAWASGPCATVIFVRVDDDAYVGYALQGGP